MTLKSLLLSLLAVGPTAAPQPGVAQAPAPASAAAAAAPPAAPPAAAPAAPAPKTAAPTPAAPAPAASKPAALAPDTQALVDRMQRFYESTQDFSADFEQEYTYKAFRRKQSSRGKVLFKRPGKMRWEYAQPSPRTFVLSESKVYSHDPEARTLSVAAVDTSQLSASVTFLLGKGRLQDEFSIRREACKECKGTLLVLDPLRPDPRFRQVRFEIDPKTAQVLRSVVIDPDGSENVIRFVNLKTNVGVPQDAFKLTPPAGTQVVDLTQQRK
jgi:outer membrane lipoprotein carrier protein